MKQERAEPRSFRYESMGTGWGVTVWDAMSEHAFSEIRDEIVRRSDEFDRTYSRFKKDSLIWKLAATTGRVAVPRDLIAMLRWYETLNALSDGKCNPLVGGTLSDLGYDADYSLTPKETIRRTPDFRSTLRIVDDEHLELAAPALIDLGGLGKGYFVDRIAEYLDQKGFRRFLVDGSGDIFYCGDGHPIRAGLEHPVDPTKAIGLVTMTEGSLCGSAGNRRKWADVHHIIDPDTGRPPERLLAAWVLADSATLADGLTTCVFLTDPERYKERWPTMEYLLLNDEYKVKRSAGFPAELF